LVVEPSTPYLGSTSALGSTGMLYLSNTSGSVIYVDASLPYPGGVSMGNPGSSPTANLPYPRGAST
jgi:hypothetical protein